MQLRIQRGSVLRFPVVQVGEITYVIVLDRFNQPVAVIEEVGQDIIHIIKAGDKDFGKVLQRLNVHELPPPISVTR